MTVVGHVEQLHLSRCYQKSATLTCTTCHNPHAEPTAAKRDTHYHAACASCHPPERCTVDPLVRAKESPQNRCVQCHMPTAPTEIPHLAFTHHRIGIHGRRAARDAALEPGVLRPVLDLARLSSIDQQRSLGLAYLETGNRERNDHLSRHYQRHAFDLLGGVHNAGLRDPALDVALARLRFDLKAGDVEPLAQAALGYPELAGQDRCNALFLLADAHAKRKDFKQALPHALELTTLRRHPADWLLLGRCREQIDGLAAAIGAYEQAVRINPRLWDVHEFLADHFRRQGDGKKAAWHQARAVK
jgi:hypothetical protein